MRLALLIIQKLAIILV